MKRLLVLVFVVLVLSPSASAVTVSGLHNVTIGDCGNATLSLSVSNPDNYTVFSRIVPVSYFFDATAVPDSLYVGPDSSLPFNLSVRVPCSFPAGRYPVSVSLVDGSGRVLWNGSFWVVVPPVENVSVSLGGASVNLSQEDYCVPVVFSNTGNIDLGVNVPNGTGWYLEPNRFSLYRNMNYSCRLCLVDPDPGVVPVRFVVANRSFGFNISVVDDVPPVLNVSIVPENPLVNDTVRILVNASDPSGVEDLYAVVDGVVYPVDCVLGECSTSFVPGGVGLVNVSVVAVDGEGNEARWDGNVSVSCRPLEVRGFPVLQKIKVGTPFAWRVFESDEPVRVVIRGFGSNGSVALSLQANGQDHALRVNETLVATSIDLVATPQARGEFSAWLSLSFPGEYCNPERNVTVHGTGSDYTPSGGFEDVIMGYNVSCTPHDNDFYDKSYMECCTRLPIDIRESDVYLPLTKASLDNMEKTYKDRVGIAEARAERYLKLFVVSIMVNIVLVLFVLFKENILLAWRNAG